MAFCSWYHGIARQRTERNRCAGNGEAGVRAVELYKSHRAYRIVIVLSFFQEQVVADGWVAACFVKYEIIPLAVLSGRSWLGTGTS